MELHEKAYHELKGIIGNVSTKMEAVSSIETPSKEIGIAANF
jgi:hypothetical protein